MFYDTTRSGFYYIDTVINNGAAYTTKSIFLSNTSVLGNLEVATLTAKEIFLLSDGTRKRDCRPVENALDVLGQLKPTLYKLDGSTSEDAGFIAQEVLETDLKFLVRTEDMHVRYTPLIAILVSAVQKLEERVKTLEARSMAP